MPELAKRKYFSEYFFKLFIQYSRFMSYTKKSDYLKGSFNQQTMLCNIFRSSLVESKTVLKDVRRPPWKTTSIKDNPNSWKLPKYIW